MPSTIFTYSPTTGTGSTQISVSAATQNTATADKSSVIGFTAGTSSTTVNLVQKYRPYFTMAGTAFPETGGTLTFTVNSEYDVAFYSIPSWITVKLGQTTYTEGQRIASGTANGSTFSLVAEANTGASRDDNFMSMGHFIGSTPQSYYQYFGTSQTGSGSYSFTSVTMNVTASVHTVGFYDVSVTLTSADDNMESTAWTFGRTTTGATGTIPVKLNAGSAPIEVEILITKQGGTGTGHFINDITFDYGIDSLYDSGDLGDAVVFNTNYQAGEQMDLVIDISESV